MERGPTAVMDAATMFGASRWLRGVHENPEYEDRAHHSRDDDQLLFVEFLHSLVMYDHIMVDSSSGSTRAQEIEELVAKVNAVGPSISLSFESRSPVRQGNKLFMTSLCRLISETLANGIRTSKELRDVPVPWAYQNHDHVDFSDLDRAASAAGLDSSLIPFALFCYRGLCYGAIAHSKFVDEGIPSAYLAAPGRLHALSKILSASDMKNHKYPFVAYGDLLNHLDLPKRGYNFSPLRSFPASHVSQLVPVLDQTAQDGLATVLKLRETPEAIEVRKEWASRIRHWSQALIGLGYSQSIARSTDLQASLVAEREKALPLSENPVVLILSANPPGTTNLRLDQEQREIQAELDRSEIGRDFRIQNRPAIRYTDLQFVVLSTTPKVLHFCGHGEAPGIIVEDEAGSPHLVPGGALGDLLGFRMVRESLRLVVLNACWSAKQARAISNRIDGVVVGMASGVSDYAAIEFARGLYGALGVRGISISEAFGLASNRVALAGHLNEKQAPRMFVRKGLDPDTIRLAG